MATLERRLKAAALPAEAEEVASRELKRLRRMSPMHSSEPPPRRARARAPAAPRRPASRRPADAPPPPPCRYSTLVDYLEWIVDLPWNTSSAERLQLTEARAKLEEDHYGMEKVKARILEFLSVCKLKGDTRGSILCMLGPPGIGKTSLGKSIATSLNRSFYRVSLGGVHTEAEVRGHRRTYVGAMPGLILQAIKKCAANNCVIMLDEIDKLGRNSLNGDPSSALLEVRAPPAARPPAAARAPAPRSRDARRLSAPPPQVLDPEQNHISATTSSTCRSTSRACSSSPLPTRSSPSPAPSATASSCWR